MTPSSIAISYQYRGIDLLCQLVGWENENQLFRMIDKFINNQFVIYAGLEGGMERNRTHESLRHLPSEIYRKQLENSNPVCLR